MGYLREHGIKAVCFDIDGSPLLCAEASCLFHALQFDEAEDEEGGCT